MGLSNVIERSRDQKSSGTEQVLTSWLIENLSESRDIHPMEPDTWIAISRWPFMCIREEILCQRDKIMRHESFDHTRLWWFGIGSAIHWLFQNRLLGKAGVLLGGWRCSECGHDVEGDDLLPRPEREYECAACKSKKRWDYVELFLKHADLKVRGRNDGILRIPEIPRELVEVKSINEWGFNSIREAPKPHHVLQGMIYLWLFRMKYGEEIDALRILYVNKAGGFLADSTREHRVEYDEKLIEGEKAKITKLRATLADANLPLPNGVCSDPKDKRAKDCSVARACFSREGGPTCGA